VPLSAQLREQVVQAVLRGDKTHPMLVEEFGVSRSTIQTWMRKYRRSGATSLAKQEKHPQDWTALERLDALLATHALDFGRLAVGPVLSGARPSIASSNPLAPRFCTKCQRGEQQIGPSCVARGESCVEKGGSTQGQSARRDSGIAGAEKKSSGPVGGARGRLNSPEYRQQLLALVDEAVNAGCRHARACEVLGVSHRPVQRWRRQGLHDHRKGTRAAPANQLASEERECSELTGDLFSEACHVEGIAPRQLVVHSDNGASMKGPILLATLQALGVMPSFGRPAVSNDNPFSEALFRTLKYCPQYPQDGFADLGGARYWVEQFITWYNTEHRHSALKFVTPHQRHDGHDHDLLARRHQTYQGPPAANTPSAGAATHATGNQSATLNSSHSHPKLCWLLST
jgi:transposase-like protein